MDKETRNSIQRATQAARELLEHEYAEQLEGVFDVRLDGTVAADPGEHLDAAQRVLRGKLVTAVEHQRTSGMSKADAVASYLREAAFTTLNRFVALKMLEARDLVQECISRGDQSGGFKEFTGLAPGLVQLPDHGYRIYIESLFDEIGREVRVLFDRRDPGSLLWPRRQGLLDLLAVLNAAGLGAVWGEDETIGWVYQYFNTDDERKKMRAESPKAPRNSRELAVRNQFFTPRYVVQFLTDNTLGRIWYEMRQGETQLRDLEYLVRRPNEVFLAEGEAPPADAEVGDEGLIQEELLQRTVYVPFRPNKDPRDIRVLDPACGSGHFLLYAFDLLLAIYEEAWADAASPSDATGRTLREDYPEVESLRAAVPELILRHNLHGIDIDPRCAQIAALALWMRAQRAYRDLDIPRDGRTALQKVNVAAAGPLPGAPGLRHDFVNTLDVNVAHLVERVFERMELAGEAGSLLLIEEDVAQAVREVLGEHGTLFEANDEAQWAQAEEGMLLALQAYSERATNERAFHRRLFADDSAAGLGFIDLLANRYDVCLMNPPFGAPPPAIGKVVNQHYVCADELGLAFCERASRVCVPNGFFGAILNSNFLLYRSYEDAKTKFLFSEVDVEVAGDLGWGVLDAQVRTVSLVACNRPSRDSAVFIDASGTNSASALADGARTLAAKSRFRPHFGRLRRLPGFPVAYRASLSLLDLLIDSPTLGDYAAVTSGCRPLSHFFRAWWEVPFEEIGPERRWRPITRGGNYREYCRPNYLVMDWRGSGEVPKAAALTRYPYLDGDTAWLFQGENLYFRPALTYSKRSQYFAAQAVGPDYVFTEEGQAIVPHDPDDHWWLLALMNSAWAHAYMSMTSGLQKQEGYVKAIPIPEPLGRDEVKRRIADLAIEAYALIHSRDSGDECYSCSPGIRVASSSEHDAESLERLRSSIDTCVLEALDLAAHDLAFVEELSSERTPPELPETGDKRFTVAQYAVGLAFGRWAESYQGEAKAAGVAAFSSWLPTMRARLADANASTGILVSDTGHPDDLGARIRTLVLASPLAEELGETRDLDAWLQREFFAFHVKHYTRARRKAPLYWQLALPSTNYSVWLYYHRLTQDTLYRVLNDYVTPKLRHEERRLASLGQEGRTSSPADQRKEVHAQEHLVSELRAFQEELARVAPLWNPNLHDGAIINFSTVWRLVPKHRAWQKECKSTWDKLCKGDYDWAHLAMHLWPERVVPKCAEDRSLAIAHELEDVFWYEDSEGKWQPRKVAQPEVDKLVKERTSAAVKDALKDLLEAPAPVMGRGARKKAPRARGTRKRTASARSEAATKGAPSPGRPTATVDAELLGKVKEVVGGNGEGASKADVVEATGITASEWNKAIKTLLADGSVTRTGRGPGTRYHLGGSDA